MSDLEIDLNFTVTEPQAAFHAMTCKYPAFVAGYGAGKSETLLNQALIDAASHPEALIALYSPTYDLVRLILAPRILSKLTEKGISYEYNKTENFIQTDSPQFGNFILRSLDTPERIVGYESYRAHIDEMDILNNEQADLAWRKILARNRQRLPIENSFNRVSVYTTPEGYKFVYDRWVRNKKDGYEYITAPSDSNPMLPDDYIQSLEASYTKEQVRAYIRGEFTNLTTGTVYKNFDRKTHDSKETVQVGEDLYIGCDFNVMNMAATVYVKRFSDQYHAVHEFFKLYDTPDMIDAIKEAFPNNKIIMYPDASGASRKSVLASTSDIAELQKAGFEVRAPKKNPFVKDRVNAVNAAFKQGKLFVNVDKCPTTTQCLEQQTYNDKGEPEKGTGSDHQNDATGYPIAYEMPIHRPFVKSNVFKYPD